MTVKIANVAILVALFSLYVGATQGLMVLHRHQFEPPHTKGDGTRPGQLTVNDFKGKNVVMFMTDQERYIQHFPPGWEEQNLPGITRMKKNGISFKRACTNTCMCSPARTTLFSGYLPAQHGVRYTLEQSMPNTSYPQVSLDPSLPNLATAMNAANMTVVYKGKLHLTKPMNADYTWQPADAGQYGFTRWNCPDAGANQALDESGGPPTNNDPRFMNSVGNYTQCNEGILQYINEFANQSTQPFFLVASLVNPHDVLFYPKSFNESYVNTSYLQGDIKIPSTAYENISYPNKPSAQHEVLDLLATGMGVLPSTADKESYLNFYGNLMKISDNYLVQVLNALDAAGLTNNTVVIRTSDHGEMGTAHGGLRQKNFNFYEEAIRIPLVFSNPVLYPTRYESDALVSHVDFVPTLASVFGTPQSAKQSNWAGVDYSELLFNPGSNKKVQDYTIFTYDDYQAGQSHGPYVQPPNHIVSIREERYKIARYYDAAQQVRKTAYQYEMYDLLVDPSEKNNIARPNHKRTPAQEAKFKELVAKLNVVIADRLKPLPLARPIALNATTATKYKNGTVITDKGKINGLPVGAGNCTFNFAVNPKANTSKTKITISSESGIIYGIANLKSTITGNNIKFEGTANFTAGTGAYRGIKATNLVFVDTNTLDGQNGRVNITGTAYY